MSTLRLTVNGEERVVDVDPARPLADVLRADLGLPGTKQSCSTGICGACTVRIDGEARKSCLQMVGGVEGADVRTVEDLVSPQTGEDGTRKLHPVQQAFLEEFGFQCGFCTPGFLNATLALLEENPDPTDAEIKDALHGNICRCTGYVAILDSVRVAADRYHPDIDTDATGPESQTAED